MVDWEAWGLGVDVASGALFVLLGIAVGLLRPRRGLTFAFAGFAVAYGAVFVLMNLGPEYFAILPRWTVHLQTGLNVVWGACLAFVAVLYPRRMPRGQRAWLLKATLATAAIAVPVFAAMPFGLESAGTLLQGLRGPGAVLYAISDTAAYLALTFFLLAGGFRLAVKVPEAHRGHQHLARVQWALLPYYGLLFGTLATDTSDTPGLLSVLAYLAAAPTVGVLWWRHARRSHSDRRAARAAAIAAFASPAVGVVIGLAGGTAWLYSSGLLGLARLFAVAVLAHGIARQHLFGLDLKLKWTLGRGAVGVLFLGTVFIGGELAETFLNRRFGWAVGAVLAGILFAAILPMQRMAESLADRAMPHVRNDSASVLASKRETYRQLYLVAWSDGVLTAKDQRSLHRFRHSLGLSEDDYAALEQEVVAGLAAANKPRRGKASPA